MQSRIAWRNADLPVLFSPMTQLILLSKDISRCWKARKLRITTRLILTTSLSRRQC